MTEHLALLVLHLEDVQQSVQGVVPDQDVVQHLPLSDQEHCRYQDTLFVSPTGDRVHQTVTNLSLAKPCLCQKCNVLTY